jgi:hypothetical protein
MMNCKEFGRKRTMDNRNNVVEFAWMDWGKARKTLAGQLVSRQRFKPKISRMQVQRETFTSTCPLCCHL